MTSVAISPGPGGLPWAGLLECLLARLGGVNIWSGHNDLKMSSGVDTVER